MNEGEMGSVLVEDGYQNILIGRNSRHLER